MIYFGFKQRLSSELQKLVSQNVISEDCARRIRDHYGLAHSNELRALGRILFAALGGIMVGAGAILLVAHNWDFMSRPWRTFFALVPFLMGYAAAFFYSLRQDRDIAWDEGLGLFIPLALGAAIALISQIYHLGGDLKDFLFTWLALSLPVIYLFDAAGLFILWLGMLLWWTGLAVDSGWSPLWIWLWFSLVVWHIVTVFRDRDRNARRSLYAWVVCLWIPIAMLVSMQNETAAMGYVAFTSLFSVYVYLWIVEEKNGVLQIPVRPLRDIGVIGLAVLSLVLACTDVWDNILRHPSFTASSWGNLTLCLLLFFLVVYFFVRSVRTKNGFGILAGSFPFLCLIGVVSVMGGMDVVVPAVVFNISALFTGIFLIYQGAGAGRKRFVNFGMKYLAILIFMRFFDTEFSLVSKGIVFIIVGVVFFSINRLFYGRRAGAGSG